MQKLFETKTIIVTFLLAFSVNLFATVPPHMRPGYCAPKKSVECEDYIKAKARPFDFDEASEVLRLQTKCAGNPGTKCLDKAEKILPWYDLNSTEDLLNIAQSCTLTNMTCFNFIETKLSSIDLNDFEDFRELAYSCARSDIRCIQDLCDTRDYSCRRKDDLLRAAKQCYQPCNNSDKK